MGLQWTKVTDEIHDSYSPKKLQTDWDENHDADEANDLLVIVTLVVDIITAVKEIFTIRIRYQGLYLRL